MADVTVHPGTAPAVAPPAERRPGNTIGRMTGLTLFTPIRRQWLPVQ